MALPGSYLAARARGIPFVLWASLWGHPRTPAHALSYLPTLHLYRHADAVVTYGPHVSRYVEERRGRRGNVFEAPQAVSLEEFSQEISPELRRHARMHTGAPPDGGFLALFVGRLVPEKGVRVLLDAWRRAGLGEGSLLALAGEGPLRAEVERAGPDVQALGFVPRDHLPSLYAAADVLVLPSVRSETFLEPWGLVVNEAMHQGTPAIVSDAVGAAAGGLVEDGRNGLVAAAGRRRGAGRAIALRRAQSGPARESRRRRERGRQPLHVRCLGRGDAAGAGRGGSGLVTVILLACRASGPSGLFFLSPPLASRRPGMVLGAARQGSHRDASTS